MSKKALGAFVAGAAVGAALGVLYAPKKGSETREDIKNLLNDLWEKAKEIKFEDVKEIVTKKLKEIKQELSELDREKVVAIAKEKAAKLKATIEELIEYAKEKGLPAVEKTAIKLKDKTLEITKGITN